jgi:hypothetical protein
MTGKQKLFADMILADPKKPKKQIIKEVYNVTTDRAAEVMASENLRKPAIMAYLNNHADKAQEVLVKAMKAKKKQYGFNPDTKRMELLGEEDDHAIRLRAADSVLDRVYGKATQRLETASTSVSFTIDLSGMGTDE